MVIAVVDDDDDDGTDATGGEFRLRCGMMRVYKDISEIWDILSP